MYTSAHMKTYNSTDLRRIATEVFETAVEDGAVKINHNGYRDTMFELIARPRGKAGCHHCYGGYMAGGGHEPGCPNKEEK